MICSNHVIEWWPNPEVFVMEQQKVDQIGMENQD